jgi:hypothetical protein
MDIGSGKGYPSASLSNFSPHQFIIHGVLCASMEGFLQSLKFKSVDMQAEVCKMVGIKAKRKGSKKKWWRDQKLYWQGTELDRQSKDYQQLIEHAFDRLAMNKKFQKAILASRNAVYSHSIGKNDPKKTVLTEREFISNLNRVREGIINGDIKPTGTEDLSIYGDSGSWDFW